MNPRTDQEQFFFSLTPDVVLSAVESTGLLCTGRCFALNSYENRVYDVEVEIEAEGNSTEGHYNDRALRQRRVIKFYRPGRWTRDQILEEHQFIADLNENEVPAIGPLRFPNGDTLASTPEGIQYAIFPRVGGRAPEEMQPEQLRWLGRLLARMHSTGQQRQAPHRIHLNQKTYGLDALAELEQGGWLPLEIHSAYRDTVNRICERAERLLEPFSVHRLHGDCHLGNLLWNAQGALQGPSFLDFDDRVNGPAVQDLWLVLPGRPGSDSVARDQLDFLLDGYESIKDFDRSQLSLIEALRALRMIHYAAWISRRWQDPAFPAAFPQFNTPRYWQDQLADLRVQLEILTT
jgi:Ser/Thr protein kinase RdoA (MazF antagonist)